LERLYTIVTPLLDQLLFPPRLVTRALDDLHRIAEAAVSFAALARDARPAFERLPDWMDGTSSSLSALRDQAEGVRTTIEPMGRDLTILRDEFGRANDEIARLREAFGPNLESLSLSADAMRSELRQVRELLATLETDINDMGERVTSEMKALRQAVSALARDADEISDVVEPLQSATDRVGRIADRLPGGRRSS
jgi:predicted  nucleic acid-binding Zn-ribbon protein